jgi:glycosyltransferase involved in cell wall biosynthesis
LRVLLAYDCLYPWTVGGAERYYRRLAERLAAEGHEVAYATRRQWPRAEPPRLDGVRVVAVSPRMPLYTADGRRRLDEALAYGAGVLAHLLRHGRRYDVVHTASFPYFSLLAAAAARPLGRYRLVVDWHELWTEGYWRGYLGGVGGRVGWWVQRRCVRVRQRAFCFARLTERRLREDGVAGPVTVLEGQWEGPLEARPGPGDEPVVVFAGRLIPEKQVPALVAAVARAREQAPELRCEIYGEGPDRAAVEEAIARSGVGDGVALRRFVATEELDARLGRATCVALPSLREGYGKVVIEAAQRGTPAVVVAAEDSAAVELVEPGVNGAIAPSAEPEALAAAILEVHRGGATLRASTAAWFDANAQRLSLGRSLETLLDAYGT